MKTSLLLPPALILTLLSCSTGAPDAVTPGEPAPPKAPDCESSGGMCLPNASSAPATYRQAKMEEGVCGRRDEICWLRQ